MVRPIPYLSAGAIIQQGPGADLQHLCQDGGTSFTGSKGHMGGHLRILAPGKIGWGSVRGSRTPRFGPFTECEVESISAGYCPDSGSDLLSSIIAGSGRSLDVNVYELTLGMGHQRAHRGRCPWSGCPCNNGGEPVEAGPTVPT
ncbi:MAG: hypothetical protein MZV70_77210 [Desulfobacterales bacterium]|nr:hypothetical protein [Desulfobacterales bacterium]